MIGLYRILPAVLGTLLIAPAVGGDPEAGASVFEDVTYRTVDDRDLKLDLAIPSGEGPFPAIIFLHGGGWITGDRSRFRDEIEAAAERGFAAATVSYRLSKTGIDDPSVDGFPAALHDVKASIRFLRANAARFRVDPKRIAVAGESAGGHLALMAGLTQPADGFEGEPPPNAPSSDVQAVVNVFGPTDLDAWVRDKPQTRPLLVMFLGGVPEVAPDRYVEASPVTYVRKDAPPILTIHGTRDGLVPVDQARRLDRALKEVGARPELLFVNGGHGFHGGNVGRVETAFYDFLERTLGEPEPLKPRS